MKTFGYERVTSTEAVTHSGSGRGAKFLAGGTNLVDLMKYEVETPTTLVDISHLNLAQVTEDQGALESALSYITLTLPTMR